MMRILTGIGVSPGVAIGKAFVREPQKFNVQCRHIETHTIEDEKNRFFDSIKKTVQDIEHLITTLSFSIEDQEILETHKMILLDPELEINVLGEIEAELVCLEFALYNYFTGVIDVFDNMENEYFSQRAIDFKEVAHRLLNYLSGETDAYIEELSGEHILLMEEMPPSKVTEFAAHDVPGICAVKGSKTSHSAIIARSIGIPMVIGIPNLLKKAVEGETVIVDGRNGLVIFSPDEDTLKKYKKYRWRQIKHKDDLKYLTGKPAITRDGVRIKILNNIEFPKELDLIKQNGADGVGLFRTEFLYIDKKELPDETFQYNIYREIAEKLHPNPLVIRTFDLGGDKLSGFLNIKQERNPNLGCRGIRLSLQYTDIFRIQLRAILRAAVSGNISVMFPMITGLDDYRAAMKILRKVRAELVAEGIECSESLSVGVMIEVPSAAILADQLAKECDFFSIGTNDLIQYTLAVDRDADNVARYYSGYHPAVLHLIEITVNSAKKANIPVSICGEMASERDFIPFLIGLGIRQLSVSPSMTLITKEQVMKLDSNALAGIIPEVKSRGSITEEQEYLKQWRTEHEY
ncbi:MAG: phosphoenolpyruvate--protein phosphotransferase [Candidatus Cloacimonetes bacterium]|nr:phosphoenolpyruvate--protein phosphotransferase [Candidatus Cloacimonadota bacterium]